MSSLHKPLSNGEGHNPIIFCDFDGTVTKKDNIIALMKEFGPPGWEELKDQILSQEISIREGVYQMFQLLPSSKKDEITKFVLERAEIREGFKEFVQFTEENPVELAIVSGGIDFFVYPLLANYDLNIYCNKANFSENKIKIEWPYPCDVECSNDCGCCKPSLLRKLGKGRYKIVIGDSITDLQAAKQADFVFARDFLLEKCKELQLNHAPYETFYEVIDILKKKGVTS